MRDRVVASAKRKIDALQSRWAALTLEKQFALAAAIVLLAGMASIGWWVANLISRAVAENTAAAVALYMESSVAPLVQELAESDGLTQATQAKLDQLLAKPAVSEHIISMNIWRLDATIVYSKWKDMIGKSFERSKNFHRAVAGSLAVEFDKLPGHDANEWAIDRDLLEIYAPVRDARSHRVIAVTEIFASGKRLKSEVRREVASSWLIVGHVTFFMMAALWGIVVRGARVIDEQRLQLRAQISELQVLLAQNENLRARLQSSNATVADANEQFLRRIGADLHDGPAQLLSYILLRLHKLAPLVQKVGTDKERRELLLIRDALKDTLREVRNVSEGLALPELGPLALRDVFELAISSHERLTNTLVSSQLDALPEDASHSLKLCAYRFVQEGLTNAFRHAGGNGQRVTARGTKLLEVTVSDGGPGLAIDGPLAGGLGLAGMRARIEVIGGKLEICSAPGKGTRLIAYFDLSKVGYESIIVS